MIKSKTQYYLKQVNRLLLLMLFAFPILPLKIAVVLILIFSFSTILNYFLVQRVELKFSYLLLLTLSFPLLYFINYLVYPQSHAAWFEFEKRISLLAMPLIFSITWVDVKKSTLFGVYNVSVLLLSSGVLVYLFVFGINQGFFSGGLSYAIRSTVELISSIHPTYFSFFAGFSFYLVLSNLLKQKFRPLNFLLRILQLFVLAAILVLLASRIFFLSSLLIIPYIIIRSRLIIIYKAGMISFFVLSLALSVIFIPGLRQRSSELEIKNFKIPGNSEINSTNLRLGIYHCSFELLKENFIWGVGTAKLQQKLNNCYESIHVDELHENNYNTHDEYLNIWLGLGLAGLMLFLAILILSFKRSLLNEEHLLFLLLFSIFCLTENLLARQYGNFLFVVFNYYFLFSKNQSLKTIG